MRLFKKICLLLLVVCIAIQFIRPVRNRSSMLSATDITKLLIIPDSVQVLLRNACYDCHSNNTNYPWYVNIQPMGWLMARHITKGKVVLNFSEFGSYTPRKQMSKLTGIANSIRDDNMPLTSYKWMHNNAWLSNDEKALLINWALGSKDSLASKN